MPAQLSALGASRDRAVVFAGFGAICGLAWAASLRGFMVEIAGQGSTFAWIGTFGQILIPGLLTGLLLGVAEHFRRTGGRRGWRWLAAAPALFILALLLTPEVLVALVTEGIGGGAIAIPIFGMLGGFAISGRGPLGGRVVAGVLATAGAIGGAIAPSMIQPRYLALTEPRGLWVALLFFSLIVAFAAACSIPHRRVAVPA